MQLNPTQAAQPKGSLYILCFIFQQVPRKFSHLTLALSTFCITFGTSGFPIPHNFTQFNLLDIHVKYLSCAPFQFWKEEVNGGGEEKGDRRQGSGFSQCIEGQTDRSREQGLELVEIKRNGFLRGIAVISILPPVGFGSLLPLRYIWQAGAHILSLCSLCVFSCYFLHPSFVFSTMDILLKYIK